MSNWCENCEASAKREAALRAEVERLTMLCPDCKDGEESKEKTHYGKDCPKGMVQIEFVISHSKKCNDYGWEPAKSASVDIYIDGKRYLVEVGNYHDGRAERRGLHIIGPIDMEIEKTAMNACSVFRVSAPEDPDCKDGERWPRI